MTDERIDRAAVERLIKENKVSVYRKYPGPIPGTGAATHFTEIVSDVFDVQAYFGGKSQLAVAVSAEGVLVDRFTLSVHWNKPVFAPPDIIPVLNESNLFVETLDDSGPVNNDNLFLNEEPPVDVSAALNLNLAFKKTVEPAGRFIRFRLRLDFAGPVGNPGKNAKAILHVSGRLFNPFFLANVARDMNAIRSNVSEDQGRHPAFTQASLLARAS